MLSKAILDCNESFEVLNLPHRLVEDVTRGDDVYDVFMAKKKNGKPKDDYPSKFWLFKVCLDFEMATMVKTADVKKNRFSVIYTSKALISKPAENSLADSCRQTVAAPIVAPKIEAANPEPVK